MNQIEQIEISKLTLLENNPRLITKDQFDKLCKSLKDDPDFFNQRPCLINRNPHGDLIVYAGNQRVRAALKLKWKRVPCIIQDDLDEEVIKSRVVKDNKTYGHFDFDLLYSEYETDVLLDAGFLEIELTGPEDVNFLDVPKETKEKKKKVCPNCAHEF